MKLFLYNIRFGIFLEHFFFHNQMSPLEVISYKILFVLSKWSRLLVGNEDNGNAAEFVSKFVLRYKHFGNFGKKPEHQFSDTFGTKNKCTKTI